MNVKVKELQGKLAKSARRCLMITTLCGDDKFVNRVLGWELSKTYGSVDKWTEHWKSVNIDDEKFGDIANAVIVSLKDAQKGKDSVERASNFLDALTSMLFEFKDEFDNDDRCNAVAQLRLIGKTVLPDGKYVDPSNSRGNEKEKNFSGRKSAFEWCHVLKAANDAQSVLDTDKGKDEFDSKVDNQAVDILNFILGDDSLAKMACSFGRQFSDWVSDQIFGFEPEVVEIVGTVPGESREKTIKLFNRFITWLKNNDPNGYIRYLAESTDGEEEPTEDKSEKKAGPTINVNIPRGGAAAPAAAIEDKEKERKGWFGKSPWEIFLAHKNDPEFTDNCWVS